MQLTQLPPQHAIGTLLYGDDLQIDQLMAESVARLKSQGVRVGGVLQRFGQRLPNGRRTMWIDNAASGVSFRLDRPRGAGATACLLDPDALARAACVVRCAVDNNVELVVVNRFGNAEASGRGLRAEIADAICAGIPLLIAVRYTLLPDWEGFLGTDAAVILPHSDAVLCWFRDGAPWRASTAAQQTNSGDPGHAPGERHHNRTMY